MFKKIISLISIIISVVILSAILSSILHYVLTLDISNGVNFSYSTLFNNLLNEEGNQVMFLIFLFAITSVMITLYFTKYQRLKIKTIKVTKDITIPVPAGQMQYGSAKLMKLMDNNKDYDFNVIKFKKKDFKKLLSQTKDIEELESLEKDNVKEIDIEEEHANLEIISIRYANDEISYDEYLAQMTKYNIEVESKNKEDYNIQKLKEMIKEKNEISKRIEACKMYEKEELQKKINDLMFKYDEIHKITNKESEVNKELDKIVEEKEKLILILNDLEDLQFLKEKFKTIIFILDSYKSSDYDVEKIEEELYKVNKSEEIILEKKETNKNLFNEGGTVIGYKKTFFYEKIYTINDDAHTQIKGSTRIGKSRRIVQPSIGITALSGESLVVTDPKGENYLFTHKFLEVLDYIVLTVDFKNPLKSNRINFLENIINAINKNNIPGAIDLTWDIVSQLVGEAKGEKLWTNGEASIIAASILCVVYDNKNRYEYQNLTNVYYFIANMTKILTNPITKEQYTLLSKYMESKPDSHPAKALFSIAEVAPERTRGSFYTSALTTLRLFTNPLIYDMTSSSDFEIGDLGKKKIALFMIIPDERTVYYPIVSLFASQIYVELSRVADENGGRIPVRVNCKYDEFGNFAQIPSFDTQLSVGAGKGIKYELHLQSDSQLEEKYGKEISSIIRGNCEFSIFLNSDNEETVFNLSKKLSDYTTAIYNSTSSGTLSGTPTDSITHVGRPLLTVSDIQAIKAPYILVNSRKNPAIMNVPDLSKWYFNKLYGMGSKSHNIKLMISRNNSRKIRSIKPLEIWGIWHDLSGKKKPSVQKSEISDEIIKKYKNYNG